MRDIASNIGVVSAVVPQVLTASNTSAAIDLQGFDAAAVLINTGAIKPGAEETAANPRARSARLRVAERTAAPAWPADSWPPQVLFGNEPSTVIVWERTKAGPSPLSQKPRSSKCITTMTG